MPFLLLSFVLHLSFFSCLGRLCFLIVAFPGYPHLFFDMVCKLHEMPKSKPIFLEKYDKRNRQFPSDEFSYKAVKVYGTGYPIQIVYRTPGMRYS